MKKRSIVYCIVSIIISLGIIGIYQMDNFRMKKVDASEVTTVDRDNSSYIMNIDSIVQGNDYIEIDGWAIEKGVTHKYFNWVAGEDENVYNNNNVVLQDESGNIYAINTVSQERNDVNQIINDDINYAKCGFKGLVKCNKLKKNQIYKVGAIITTLDDEQILVMSEEEIIL